MNRVVWALCVMAVIMSGCVESWRSSLAGEKSPPQGFSVTGE